MVSDGKYNIIQDWAGSAGIVSGSTDTHGGGGGYSGTLGTLENPAVSAQALYDDGQTTSGWYYIQTGLMDSPKQVYCNQTDNGGGWMLISYNKDNYTGGTPGNPYPNQWIDGEGTLNKLSVDAEELWYSISGSSQCDSVMRMASINSVDPLLENCEIAHQTVYSNPTALDLSEETGSVLTLKNASPLLGTWTALKGYTLMTTHSVAAPVDWLYDTSNWWTTNGPTSAYPDNPYGRSGNAQGTGGWTNRNVTNIYGMANVSTTTNSGRTDLKTLAVYIK